MNRSAVIAIERSLILAAVLLGTGGYLASNFIPTDFGLAMGLACTLLLAGFASLLQCLTRAGIRDGESPLRGMLAIGLLVFFFGWYAVTLGLFGLYAVTLGTSSDRVEKVEYWQSPSHWGCEGAVVANIWSRSSAICLGREFKKRYPPGSLIHLRGPGTALGIVVFDVA